MSTPRIDTNWSIAFASPNYTITYASVYGAETVNADTATIVASTRNDDVLLINQTALRYSKCTSPSEASRTALIAAITALNVAAVTTPDNHYVITTKAEFDTAISEATTAAVPYRFEIAAGTYAFTARVVFPANGEISGAGQNVTILTTTYAVLNTGAFDFAANITIRDLTFNHLDNGYDGSGAYDLVKLNPTASSYNRITNCRFTQFDGQSLLVRSSGSGAVTEITNCLFDEPHTSGFDAGIYVNGTSTGASIQVTGCTFKGPEYGYYCDAAGITEKIIGCLFDSNGTNPFFTSSNTARSVILTNNDFRDCAGDITFPTNTSNITEFHFGGNAFDNFTGSKPYQTGDSVSDIQTSTSSITYNGRTPVNVLSLSNLTTGTWLISYKLGMTAQSGDVHACGVHLDNSGTGTSNDSDTAGYESSLIPESQIIGNGATNVGNIQISHSFLFETTELADLHLNIVNSDASNTTGLAVGTNYSNDIRPNTTGDHRPFFSAIKIK